MFMDNMTEEDGQWCMSNLEKSYYSKTFALSSGVNALLNYIKDNIWESDIVLKPYNFNCRGEECFFQTHKDTYSDNDLVGTLIVIPCSTFEGGDLSFPIQNKSINVAKNVQSGLLQFIYFDIKYLHAVTLVEYKEHTDSSL